VLRFWYWNWKNEESTKSIFSCLNKKSKD
jgi:hypothetical protein